MAAVVQTDEVNYSKEGIQFFLAMPLSDLVAFSELKKSVLHLFDSLKGTEMVPEKMKNNIPVIKHNDGLMVVSLKAETAQAFLDNPGNGTVPSWINAYSGYPMLMNVNISGLIQTLIASSKKPMREKEKFFMDFLDQVIAYGGKYENGSLNSVVEFRLKNETENSLKQLIELFGSLIERASDSEQEENADQ